MGYEPIEWEGASPEEAAIVGRVVGCARDFGDGVGKEFREHCERFYRQYRGFKQIQAAWRASANPRDRDNVAQEAEKRWGAALHIPMSFRAIETMVPRAIANMPKLLYLPRDEQWRKNVETVRLLINAQQRQISIDLPFQAVMRNGGIYGLGVGKAYWLKEELRRRRMEPGAINPSEYVLGAPRQEVTFDDPMFEDVDVFDFMWDPYGSDMRTCEWVIHRQWVSTRKIMARVESGQWATPSARSLAPEAIGSLTVDRRFYDEVWSDRMQASGFTNYHLNARGEDQPHELLEYHNGERVVSVLDRKVLVQDGENPCGYMPFQVFRPTPVPKQLVGIGWLEPIEQLNRELDTLRSQRRDAASVALNAGYAFDDNAVDEEDLVFGPAAAIRVTNGRPADALMPLPVRDVPGSGYEEENAIRADLEAVSGESDALNNAPGGTEGTATEATLQQAALGRRIQLASRRFELEVVKPAAYCFLYLDQRMISANRPALMIPSEDVSQDAANTGQEPDDDDSTGKWRLFPVGPGELEGDYEIEPEGGSMAARNVPQDRADAQLMLNMLAHDFYINPTKARLRAMELLGIEHPQSWLRDPTPSVPMATLQLLLQGGVDPLLLAEAVIRGREVSAPQEGPSSNQINEQMPAEAAEAEQTVQR